MFRVFFSFFSFLLILEKIKMDRNYSTLGFRSKNIPSEKETKQIRKR